MQALLEGELDRHFKGSTDSPDLIYGVFISHQNVFQDTICSYDYSDSVNNKFKTIAAFECRGLEPIEFSPRNGWTVDGFKVMIE